jgi:hypothetical protein
MEYQSVAIIKDENDSSQMLILNIEKLAETIVIKGNGLQNHDRRFDSCMGLIKMGS